MATARFSINGSTGALIYASAPSYENQTGSDTNNVRNAQVTATDNDTGNLTDIQGATIGINNGNENPIITSGGGAIDL